MEQAARQTLHPEARMTVHAVELDPQPVHRSFRLTRSKPHAAVSSQVRPALVLPDGQARKLLAAAERGDVSRGGCFSAGPAGIQIWSGPWDGVLGTHGSSEHHGSIDWCYDSPTRHYITIYRVLVTARGAAAGQTTTGLLARVLSMAGVDSSDTAALAPPPPRDPFLSENRRDRLPG
jgi:hypothetical protein